MKPFTLSLAGLLMAGLLAAPAEAQQDAPGTPPASSPQVRQRAPGVPMAPRTDMARLRSDQGARPEQRQEADRNLPMPRGVPSIIAP